MAARLAFIGRFPPSFPSPTRLPSPRHCRPVSEDASRDKYTQKPQLLALLLRNLLYDVIPSSKGLTTNLHGETNNMVAFVLPWLFSDYYFMVKLLVHFPEDGSMSSSLKLIHTTTIPISTASQTPK